MKQSLPMARNSVVPASPEVDAEMLCPPPGESKADPATFQLNLSEIDSMLTKPIRFDPRGYPKFKEVLPVGLNAACAQASAPADGLAAAL